MADVSSWGPTAGYPAYAGYEPPLVTIGDIVCSEHYVVTPQGAYPIAGSTWTVSNYVTVGERIPTYAIVLAVVFAMFCLLGLLFLLIKERTQQGVIQVHVHGHGFAWTTQIPVAYVGQVADVERQVATARSIATVASYGSN